MKIHHLKDWNATAMLTHAIERIPPEQACIVLFYEDGEVCTLSSHVDNQHAIWMYELAKLSVLHECMNH